MGKRGRILIVVAAIALLGVVVWTVFYAPSRAPEPVYNGIPLGVWLDHVAFGPGNIPAFNEGLVAIREIGTNAIPDLLRMLRAHDSPLKTKIMIWATWHRVPGIHYTDPQIDNYRGSIGFRTLGYRAISAVPEVISILDRNISPDSATYSAATLGDFGSDAAVPSLLRALANPDENVRGCAIHALGQIRADPDTVVPALTNMLHNPSIINRGEAAMALGSFGSRARSAVPALLAWHDDPNTNATPPPNVFDSFDLRLYTRSQTEQALRQIDRDAYVRAVMSDPPSAGQSK
jgi:hypothetical protein